MKSHRVRRVAVITGSRAEFGLLRSTMQAIRAHPDLSLQVVVTGMHLLRRFGHTVDDIRRDGWTIDAKIPMQKGDDGPLDQSEGLSRGVRGIARFLHAGASDVALVLGDRVEAIAGGLAAVAVHCPLAHIHGGDIAPGDLDDRFRGALTKLADVHFPATQAARRRIVRMDTPADRVICVGAPGLDDLRARIRCMDKKARPRSDRALVVQHPIGRSPRVEQRVMTAILCAVRRQNMSATVVYPNSDRGHSGIVEAIERHRSRKDVEVTTSLKRADYIDALIAAPLIIGNSSSGIIEAATAGTPAVNVGERQRGRERSGSSVVDCGESVAEIERAVEMARRKRPRLGAPSRYGDGQAGCRIADELASDLLDRF